jgi:hypothetical protein
MVLEIHEMEMKTKMEQHNFSRTVAIASWDAARTASASETLVAVPSPYRKTW